MANIAKIDYMQSDDGKTLVLKDSSTLDSPIGNYVRTVRLYSDKDGSGNLLDTLTFNGSDLTVEKAITSDRYYSAVLTHTGSPSVPNAINNFGTTQFEYIALDKLLLKNCGCDKRSGCDKTTLGALYLKRAQDQVLAGNTAKFNSYIQASLKVLNG